MGLKIPFLHKGNLWEKDFGHNFCIAHAATHFYQLRSDHFPELCFGRGTWNNWWELKESSRFPPTKLGRLAKCLRDTLAIFLGYISWTSWGKKLVEQLTIDMCKEQLRKDQWIAYRTFTGSWLTGLLWTKSSTLNIPFYSSYPLNLTPF